MNINTKLIYLDSMAFNDMSLFLTTSEIKSYLELRHRTKRNAGMDTKRISSRIVEEDL